MLMSTQAHNENYNRSIDNIKTINQKQKKHMKTHVKATIDNTLTNKNDDG